MLEWRFTNCLRDREAVTEKLKTDIEQLRDDFATANIEPPDDLVEFFELLRDAE